MWLMRQAGRYLPEYLKTRQQAGSFMGLAQSPQLATEVTLQPLDRYDLDAAILFSDILTIPDAMGLGLSFVQGEGPKFSQPLKTEESILKLEVADMHKLQYVFDAVSSITKALDQKLPLIGFSGSPFTLACYMTEGSGSHNNFEYTRSLMYKRPDLFEHILKINTQSVIDYLDQQALAGVNAFMIFDTWGGLLAEQNYLNFSLKYMQQIVTALKQKHPTIPCIIFTKGGGVWLPHLANVENISGIGIDWTINIGRARQIVDASKNTNTSKIALQGNLDPVILLSTPEQIEQSATDMVNSYYQVNKNLTGYIANLGHGISQYTNPSHVEVYVNTVKAVSKKLLSIDKP
jgi:uroporphyrinogen decarboxylase